MDQNKTYISYNKYTELLDNLYTKTKVYEPDIIIGISRGGVIPGVMLSHKFNIPFRTLHWSTRDHVIDDKKSEMNDYFYSIVNNKKVLVVDDICDTGKTLSDIHREFVYKKLLDVSFRANIYYGCLHMREGATFPINCYSELISDDSWIVYPYEIDKVHERGYN